MKTKTINPSYLYETPDMIIVSNRYNNPNNKSVHWTPPTSSEPDYLMHTLEERLPDLKQEGDKLLIPHNTGGHWIGVVIEKKGANKLEVKILDSIDSKDGNAEDYNKFHTAILNIKAKKISDLNRLEERLTPDRPLLERIRIDQDIEIKTKQLESWPEYKVDKAKPSIKVWKQGLKPTCGGYTIENLRREGYQQELDAEGPNDSVIRSKHAEILPYDIIYPHKLTEEIFDERMHQAYVVTTSKATSSTSPDSEVGNKPDDSSPAQKPQEEDQQEKSRTFTSLTTPIAPTTPTATKRDKIIELQAILETLSQNHNSDSTTTKSPARTPNPKIIENLPETLKSARKERNPDVYEGLGISGKFIAGKGFQIDKITPGSTAAQMNLESGKYITHLNGKDITSTRPDKILELLNEFRDAGKNKDDGKFNITVNGNQINGKRREDAAIICGDRAYNAETISHLLSPKPGRSR